MLDEPTTGLDEASGRRLMSALVEAGRGRTIIVLTHDPVVLEHVDRVVMMETPASISVPDAVTPA